MNTGIDLQAMARNQLVGVVEGGQPSQFALVHLGREVVAVACHDVLPDGQVHGL